MITEQPFNAVVHTQVDSILLLSMGRSDLSIIRWALATAKDVPPSFQGRIPEMLEELAAASHRMATAKVAEP